MSSPSRAGAESVYANAGKAVAALTGAAIPGMLLGRATLQGLLAAALLIVLAIIVSGHWRPALSRWKAPMAIAASLVLLAWLPSALLSIDVRMSAPTWLRTALFLLGSGLLHLYLTDHPAVFRLCLKVLVAATLGLCLLAIVRLGIAGAFSVVTPEAHDLALRLKAAASALACLAGVTLWAGHRLGRGWALAAWASLPAALTLIQIAQSRSALAGLLIGTGAACLLAALRDRRLWLPAAALVAAALSGALFYLAHRPIVSAGLDLYLPGWLIDPHRQMIWKFIFANWLDSPLFGHGINTANMLPGAQTRIPGINVEVVPSHPHNWALEILVETGLVGFLTLLGTVLWAFGRAARVFLREGDKRHLCLSVLLVVFWSSALFNFSLWSTWWMITLMALYAIVSADRRDA